MWDSTHYKLEQHSFSSEGEALCIYGDPPYPHRIHLQHPFATYTRGNRPSIHKQGSHFSQMGIWRYCELPIMLNYGIVEDVGTLEEFLKVSSNREEFLLYMEYFPEHSKVIEAKTRG